MNKKFSVEDLIQFNGKEGKPAYIAYKGKIYDVSKSSLWENGHHMQSHLAGADLTQELTLAPHGEEVFEQFEFVGMLAEEKKPTQMPPWWANASMKNHAHPIMVHFPQSFYIFAPLFLMLFYIFNNRFFERTAFYLMIASFITAIPAIITGVVHWIYKFKNNKSSLFISKIICSVIVLVNSGLALYFHFSAGFLSVEQVNIFVLVLYFLNIPLAILLGRNGGKIVFG